MAGRGRRSGLRRKMDEYFVDWGPGPRDEDIGLCVLSGGHVWENITKSKWAMRWGCEKCGYVVKSWLKPGPTGELTSPT